MTLFKDERDYKEFRTWITDGSTLGQRMQMGHEPPIPDHWKALKPLFKKIPIDKFPLTLEEYVEVFENAG